jgi:hypothetical protein
MKTKKILLAATAALSLANFGSSFAMQKEKKQKQENTAELAKLFPKKEDIAAFYTKIAPKKNVREYLENQDDLMLPLMIETYKKAVQAGKNKLANKIKKVIQKKLKLVLDKFSVLEEKVKKMEESKQTEYLSNSPLMMLLIKISTYLKDDDTSHVLFTKEEKIFLSGLLSIAISAKIQNVLSATDGTKK